MNIILADLAGNLTKNFILNWIDHYKKSQTDIPVILYCDMITDDIDRYWIYPVICKSIRNCVILPKDQNDFYDKVNTFMFSIIHKLNVFDDCGECLILDSGSLIKQKITRSCFPQCSWGLVKRNNFSKSYLETRTQNYFTNFPNINFLERVDPNVHIIKKSISSKYVQNYTTNIKHANTLKELYPEAILSLTHKQLNGVFLCDDWAWPVDSLIRNKTIIIEQYSLSYHRALLQFSLENNISFEIDNKPISKELYNAS